MKRSVPPPGATARSTDPWFARLAFHLLRKAAPWWVTLWLVLVLGALVALGAVAGPWVPSMLTAAVALTAGIVATGRRITGRTPEVPPDPALEPPP
jgi:hypothetical protein